MSKRTLLATLLVAIGLSLASSQEQVNAKATKGPLKVFLLAGQSNMEGKGAVNTLDWLGEDPEHGHLLDTIKKEDGSWVVRDDVWIWYLGRKGKLTVGYGSEKSPHAPLIGPELGFGTVLGDHLDEQVLLIKTAWGGKDVANDFRAPGKAGPGEFYTKMLEHVPDVLSNLETLFPEYDGKGYELCGLVWFQGWNDMVSDEKTAAYTENLAQMIRDLRKDLGVPKLPVVIGELGVGGVKAEGGKARFREAQKAVALLPELEGNVLFVQTGRFYDTFAHKLYEEDVWKGPDKERFYRIASDRPYHYLGSGKTFLLMGHAFGKGMIELLGKE